VADSHGSFVWYELMTTNVAAAKAFYAEVIGWSVVDVSMPGMPYALFTTGKTSVSGVLGLPMDARRRGAKPRWLGYVGVNDVDAAARRATQLGGAVHVPPTDIPSISRFAIVADPQMATLGVFKGLQPAQPRPTEQNETGRVSWHELLATDWEKALAFYGELFGWQKADGDTGPKGRYQVFSTEGQMIGGMFNKPPVVPDPFWLYYFSVADLDAAAKRVMAGGGQIIEGPVEVPGGSWIARCVDPQGVLFALEGKRSDNASGGFEPVASRNPSEAQGGRWYWWIDRQ
jgi:predicted enzyme related to lactoylglutathione lyase